MKKILRFLRLKYIGRSCRISTFWWSQLFATFGSDSVVLGTIVVKQPENIYVGERVGINPGCTFSARDKIVIKDDVSISTGVIINTGGLDYSVKRNTKEHTNGEVYIEEGVWIGSGAVINAGVRLGHHCVIGAGAVVTKDTPPETVVVGVPARVIKHIEYRT